MPRVLLLVPSQTYRAPDFLAAARRVGVELTVVSDHRQAWEPDSPSEGAARSLVVDFSDAGASAATILAGVGGEAIAAVVAVDDIGVVTASLVAEQLGLSGNPPAAASATRDKAGMRELLAAAGVPQPTFVVLDPGDQGTKAAARLGYPLVVKPVNLSASRGVIRCDHPDDLAATIDRVRAIAGRSATLLLERFVPGDEVAVEAIVRAGDLEVLAVFDKPDPLDGPYFAETLYVTPSRHPAEVVARVVDAISGAAAAVGLRDGPLHGEARITPSGDVVVLEVAARTIGGLCSRTLQFGLGVSLEELVLRHALGRPLGSLERVAPAAGVVMLPVPRAGVLRAVDGVEVAAAIPGVTGIEITVVPGTRLEPLPENDRYLGFLFARGPDPATVESTLRTAWAALTVIID
jgi:biotin carboxylase